jgi:glyoxylase-like metal-dependent hydrolase (beta-lactamase superfamily II)
MSASSSEPGEDATPHIECIPNGLLQANCYLVICPETDEALLIDPGAEPEQILQHVQTAGCRVSHLLHTHGHFDHIGATEAVMAGLARMVSLFGHPADGYLYEREARARGQQFGYIVPETLIVPDHHLADGTQFMIGALRFEVIHTPGHTPGSISLICGTTTVFTGDTLFRRGIGRTDLPGGDEDQIYESILTRLYPLDESLRVLPGHGPATTIGEEKRANPFVQAS